jgi:predicted nucleic acid-binding protein
VLRIIVEGELLLTSSPPRWSRLCPSIYLISTRKYLIIALDTTVLVEAEVSDSPSHEAALALIASRPAEADSRPFAIAPQVLTEFIHVVSDPKRFARPLSVRAAIDRAEFWWSAREVQRIVPTLEATALFFRWMRLQNLRRKRILDTYLAATYAAAGIRRLATSYGRDFTAFDAFEIIEVDTR